MEEKVKLFNAHAFGTLFFDDGFIYLADRNIPRVAVFTVDDIIIEGQTFSKW